MKQARHAGRINTKLKTKLYIKHKVPIPYCFQFAFLSSTEKVVMCGHQNVACVLPQFQQDQQRSWHLLWTSCEWGAKPTPCFIISYNLYLQHGEREKLRVRSEPDINVTSKKANMLTSSLKIKNTMGVVQSVFLAPGLTAKINNPQMRKWNFVSSTQVKIIRSTEYATKYQWRRCKPFQFPQTIIIIIIIIVICAHIHINISDIRWQRTQLHEN
jgi:hypothetical protein